MHGELIIGPDGLEAIWPGNDPYTANDWEPVIPDWISYGLELGDQPADAYSGSLDFLKNLMSNRDRHYRDQGQSIDLLRPQFEGKTVLIICPGPSCSKVLGECELPDDVAILAINKAVGFVRLDKPNRCALIMERNAKESWLRTSRDQMLAPWIPSCPLITIPESSEWLADLWPVENRYYCNVSWHNAPKDSRAVYPKLLSWYITPVLAMDVARYLGAAKIVLVGCDMAFSMDGMYYYDTHFTKHPNAPEHKALFWRQGPTGELCQSSSTFVFQRNGLEAVAYWIERTARIPVLNASGQGIFDWRMTPLEEALHGTHEPQVDYFSGRIEGPGSCIEPDAPKAVHPRVAQTELQGTLACG